MAAFAASILAVGALTGTGLALARSDVPAKPAREATSDPSSSAVLAAFSAFQRPASQADKDAASSLSAAYAGAPGDSAVSQTDWSQARSAPIQGSTARAWLAPAGSDVCVFAPAPNSSDAPGGSCVGLDVANRGLGFTASIPKLDSASAANPKLASFAVLVPDGMSGPKVEDPSGATTTIEPQSNIAAAVVPSADTLIIGGRRIALAVDMTKFHMEQPGK